MTGRPPFNGANHIQLLQNIQKSEAQLPAALEQQLSGGCKSMIHALLKRDPVGRISFDEFFAHGFLQQGLPAAGAGASTSSAAPPAAMVQPVGSRSPLQLSAAHWDPLQGHGARPAAAAAAAVGHHALAPQLTAALHLAQPPASAAAAGARVHTPPSSQQQQPLPAAAAAAAAAIMHPVPGTISGTPAPQAAAAAVRAAVPQNYIAMSSGPTGISSRVPAAAGPAPRRPYASTNSLDDDEEMDYVLISNPDAATSGRSSASSSASEPTLKFLYPGPPPQLLQGTAAVLGAGPQSALHQECRQQQYHQNKQQQQQHHYQYQHQHHQHHYQQQQPPLPAWAAPIGAPDACGAAKTSSSLTPSEFGGVPPLGLPEQVALLSRVVGIAERLAVRTENSQDTHGALSLHLFSLQLGAAVLKLNAEGPSSGGTAVSAAAAQLSGPLQQAAGRVQVMAQQGVDAASSSSALPESLGLLYQYAVASCRVAALDELLGVCSNAQHEFSEARDVFTLLLADFGALSPQLGTSIIHGRWQHNSSENSDGCTGDLQYKLRKCAGWLQRVLIS